MEMLLSEPKTSALYEMALKGRSSPLKSVRCKAKTSVQLPQCSSCRGVSPKASYSSTWRKVYTSNATVGSTGQQRQALTYEINGTHGAALKLFPSQVRLLDAMDDEYGGLVVDPDGLPTNPNAFSASLQLSLSHWKRKGKKGIWLKLPLERSELVPVAVKEGFQYHHAEPRYVMLTYWIPEGPCLLPANASHQVGVGGFVINDKNEVLVVQEKYCAPDCVDFWKIPTGFIPESEEIFTGVVREVKEETGVDTEFVEVMAFRHAHHLAFGKSDLLFVCMLRPLSTQIMVDDFEIQAAKWMPLVEFVEQPLVQEDCMFRRIVDICLDRLGKRYCGLSVHQLASKFDGRPSSLYFNTTDARCFGS